MMGIGFGRGTTVQTSPVYNVALNLPEMATGAMRRGYIIKRTGLDLGLTPANVGNGFVTQQLISAGSPAAGTHNDWMTPSGGFQIGTAGAEQTGTVLVDTGLLDMIVEGSGLPASGTVASATPMTISIGSQKYSFTVGDGSPSTPTSVNYAYPAHGAFVNTGLRALHNYDVLFDADAGLYGLRNSGQAATQGFTVAAAPSSLNVAAGGGTVRSTITVASAAGMAFGDAVTLTASGQPPGTTVSFSPASVTPGASGATSTMTITAAAAAATSSTRIAFASLLLPFLGVVRRRKLRMASLLMVMLAFGVAVGLIGCGGGGSSVSGGSTTLAPQNYTITITGTSGTTTNSTTVTLTQ
jgi:hypothetical protein